MRYFLVEDVGSPATKQITDGPRSLPKSWRNVSGLDKADSTFLKERGWLPEEVVGDVPYDDATHVKDGPTFEIQEDKVVSTYTIRVKTSEEVESLKGRKVSELKSARNTEIRGGFPSLGTTFDSDSQAISNINGKITDILLGTVIPEGYIWVDYFNNSVVVTAEDIKQMGRDAVTHREGLMQKYWTLKAQVESATTASEVAAIVWEGSP